jgi:hypothetical protein
VLHRDVAVKVVKKNPLSIKRQSRTCFRKRALPRRCLIRISAPSTKLARATANSTS